jgi:hypothetical protein
MNEISEDNLELNFRRIMYWALNDEVEEVRQRAIDGLSEEDHPRIIRPLLARLQHDTSPVVRSHAALALAKFTTLISYGELSTDIGNEIVETLHHELDTNRTFIDVYRRILEALGAVHSITHGKAIISNSVRAHSLPWDAALIRNGCR